LKNIAIDLPFHHKQTMLIIIVIELICFFLQAIQVPKVFILELLQTYIDTADMIPLAAQHILSQNYLISTSARHTAFSLAFRLYMKYNKPPMFGGSFSREQKMVVETAAKFYRKTHLYDLELEEKGLPHNLETCQELLEEAQVFEDLYGQFK
jgi:hypothetical protein